MGEMTFRPVCRYKSGTDEQERNKNNEMKYSENSTIHFHDEMHCSAKNIDFVKFNKIRAENGYLTYYGNYFDDDITGVYMLFGIEQYRFCVKID